VDNNSPDGTPEVVRRFATTTGLNVRYLFEPLPGLSQARNRSLKSAAGEVLAFVDDDVIVDRMWLSNLHAEFASDRSVAVLFGQTRAYDTHQLRLSLKDKPEKEYYRFPCSPWGGGHGNNMSIRASIVRQIGFFDSELGVGTPAGSAEDIDYVYRVLRAHHTVVYAPGPLVYHQDTRTSAEGIRIKINYARGRGAFYGKYLLRGDVFAARLLLAELKGLGAALVFGSPRRRAAVTMRALMQGVFLRIRQELSVAWKRPLPASLLPGRGR